MRFGRPGGKQELHGVAPTYLLSRWLFLRLLGVVYLIAFASIAMQITGLVGEHGILPAGAYLAWTRSAYGSDAYRILPTLFWFGAGDVALRGVAWTGVGLAILLIFGIAPWASLLLLWALYLSISVVGQDFLSFQWDVLLLETGLIATLWAPLQWRPRWQEPPPSPAVRWLLVFLLFKLVFLSGATKLSSGDPTWRSGTALDYHFETQPLPAWTAWYAHHLPEMIHRVMTYGSLATELFVPCLLFLPQRFRRARLFALIALAGLQVSIAATGNYGFFNLLAIVLCIPSLDDAALRRVIPLPLTARSGVGGPRLGMVAAIAVVFFVPSLLSGIRELSYAAPFGSTILGVVDPLRSFNGYGLFRVMTTERLEIVFEGSRDGERWKEYEFRFKPGDIRRKPGFVAPYHPRLDWQMWFMALDPAGNGALLDALADRLREGTPEVLALLGPTPFPGSPPKFLRAIIYEYRFSSPDQRKQTGAWWTRSPVAKVPLGP